MVCTEILQRFFLSALIHFVEQRDHLLILYSEMIQCLINDMHLFIHLRIRSIYNMENIVCIFCFFKCAFKRLDQMVRKLADKSYRVCQKHLLMSIQFQHTGGRVECCKKLIFFEYLCISQMI